MVGRAQLAQTQSASVVGGTVASLAGGAGRLAGTTARGASRLKPAAAAAPAQKHGRLQRASLEREIGVWQRFKNRRQVSSYLGLCPSQNSFGVAELLSSDDTERENV